MFDTLCMATPKKEPKRTEDRHKPHRMLRVRQAFADAIQALADRNSSDFTEEGNRMIREWLEKEGLWPPRPAQSANRRTHR